MRTVGGSDKTGGGPFDQISVTGKDETCSSNRAITGVFTPETRCGIRWRVLGCLSV